MASQICKEWMKERERGNARYIEGIANFMDFVAKNGGGGDMFSCPCTKCENGRLLKIEDIHFYLLQNGMLQSYTFWRFHGEKESSNVKVEPIIENVKQKDVEPDFPRIEDLIYDSFEMFHREVDNSTNETAKGFKFEELQGKASEPLYPSCPKRHTTLYFLVKLNNVKTRYGLSDNSFNDILGLFREFLPEENTTPKNYPEMKSIIRKWWLRGMA
ncbi:hypothetical protein LguiA_018347 [Lonicera macranthoides]